MSKICTVTIFKELGGLGSADGWNNTYTISGPDNLKAQEWSDVVNLYALEESQFHLNTVKFTRAIIRTQVKGDSKGHPENSHALPLNYTGQVLGDIDDEVNANHSLPGAMVLVGTLGGSGIRLSRMQYRHCLGEDFWKNTNGRAIATQPCIDLIVGHLGNILGGMKNRAGFAWLQGGKYSNANNPVTAVGCGGIQLRQEHQQKKGKGKFVADDPASITDLLADMADLTARVVGVYSARHNPVVAAILAAGATTAALNAANDAIDLTRGAIDSGDLGPPALPPAGN